MPTSTGRQQSSYQWGIGYILFIAGMVLSVYLSSSVLRGYDTLNWQQSNGIIYRSTMIETTRVGDQPLYQPDVSYRYQFRGETFDGVNLYRTDIPFNPERELGRELDNFPVGSIQLVYINPERPSESVLVQGVQTQFVVGLLFALTCFGMGLASFRSR
jgi:hypothetical protein